MTGIDGTKHRPRPWWTRAWALPLAIALFQVVGSTGAQHDQPDRLSLDAAGYLLLLAGPTALVFRRRYPVAVLVTVLAVTHGYILADYPYGPVFISLIVAIVTAVVRGHRVAAWAAVFGSFCAYLALTRLPGGQPPPGLGPTTAIAAWLLVVLTVSDIIRSRREQAAEVARARREEERRQASEERMRIARELHDVLAHNISLINVQAGVALHLIDEQPEQARTALTAIKSASKEALGELRSVLDVLRHGEGDAAPRSPAPGLARVDELAERTRAAGIPVRLLVNGDARSVPGGVDLAAYRIVQEALTNVVRHAGPAHATVTVTYEDTGVVVQVDDDGRAHGADTFTGAGRGITGMRERVEALGGEFAAGPRPQGGFRVWARLPLAPPPLEGEA